MHTSFKDFNPITQALFFLSVLIITMFNMHPILLVISLAASAVYTGYTGGIGALVASIKLMAVTSIMIIIINPLISHEGITVLTRLPDGNELTLESVIFASAAALMMSCTVEWFYCVNRIFTSDRIIYLFGRITPKLALMISMTLNFISKFRVHFAEIRSARYAIEKNDSSFRIASKMNNSVKIISSMLQWSAENAVDTADSMKSRGYGIKKRTSYTRMKITCADVIYILLIAAADSILAWLIMSGALGSSYYPYFEIEYNGIQTVSGYIIYGLLCMMPIITDVKGELKWRCLISKV